MQVAVYTGPDDSLELVIRTATWRDLRAIVRLEKACFGRDAWPWIELLWALTFPGTVRIKAQLGEQVVGFAIGDRRMMNPELGWVASIGVDPAHRRQGIGRRLLKACEEQLGTRRIRLSLKSSNEAALALYRRSGYKQVDSWPKYYRDGEDALVMELVRDLW